MRREDPRRVPLRRIGLLFGAAALVVVAIVAAILISGRSAEAETVAPLQRDPLLVGIPQDGVALGNPKAPVTLVEFADLQCPFCAHFAGDPLRTVVDEYVRPGKVRLEFRGLAFLGPDSDKALRAALAAGEQDRLWDVVHELYAMQGHENSGWVSDTLLESLAYPGFDVDRMLAETSSPAVDRELKSAADEAQRLDVNSTPTLFAGPTGGTLGRLAPATHEDPASIRAELDRLLAG